MYLNVKFNKYYIKYISVLNVYVLATFEFSIVVELSSDFYQVQISTNNEKFTLKFVFLSIALARQNSTLSVVGEITAIKRYIL